MSLRTTVLATACALALGMFSVPAFAEMTNFDGVADVNYSNTDLNHSGGSFNSWGANGTGAFGLSPNWTAQIDGSYHHLDGSGSSANDWHVGGTAFWHSMNGRIGATVGYSDISGGGLSQNATNYGLFGEWFASSAITAGLKGGAFNGDHGLKGDYAGAAITGYIHNDFAITGGYDYAHFQHAGNENDWSIQGEWLISEHTPFSVYGGYENSKISSAGPTANTWFLGIRYYCDPTGDATLVDRQRNGTATWGPAFGPVGLKF